MKSLWIADIRHAKANRSNGFWTPPERQSVQFHILDESTVIPDSELCLGAPVYSRSITKSNKAPTNVEKREVALKQPTCLHLRVHIKCLDEGPKWWDSPESGLSWRLHESTTLRGGTTIHWRRW